MSFKQSLKYSSDVPKGYDASKIQYTFDFIYLVLKRDASIERAVEGVAYEYGLSETYLNDYIIENKYILNKINKDEFAREVKLYNTKSLKKILKSHGIKATGKREKIEEKVFKSNLLGNNYVLSSKSKVFYKNKKRRIRIFTENLEDYYYFDEFNDFYMDNYRKREAKIPVEFIKLHISKALGDENHDNYIFNTHVMAEHYHNRERYTLMLEYVLKNFCMNLNPVWKIGELEGHTGVLGDTYEDLMFLRRELSKNTIINNYYLIWDSFNFDKIIISKYEGYRVLKDLLNLKNYDKINDDLDRRFYSNRDLKIKKIIQKTLFDF